LRQPHYLISGKRPMDFYAEYFIKIKRFVPAVRDYIKCNYTKKGEAEARRTLYDFYDTGRVICTTCDDEIESDVEKHNHDPKFEKPYHYDGDQMAQSLESLRELVRLAKEKGFHLTIFINPLHKTTYLDTDPALFFAFKEKLADITDYYDFSGLNTITTNNYYYYETSHFRQMVGDMMLRKMFGYPGIQVPPDFGVLVTRGSVKDHIQRQREEVNPGRERTSVFR
jgi:hypothetical protein